MSELSYKELMEAWEAIRSDHPEPDVIYTNGANLKWMAHKYYGADPDSLRDIDGTKIYDGLAYACTREGYIPINDDGDRVKVVP